MVGSGLELGVVDGERLRPASWHTNIFLFLLECWYESQSMINMEISLSFSLLFGFLQKSYGLNRSFPLVETIRGKRNGITHEIQCKWTTS